MSGLPPAEPPPPRRRRWKVLAVVLAFGLVLVFGPMAVAPLVLDRIVEELNRELDGHLEVGELSLNPFGRIGIAGFRLLDGRGQPVVLARRVQVETSILGLLGGDFDGSLLIEGVEVHLRPEYRAKLQAEPIRVALERRFASSGGDRVHFHRLPRVRGTVEIRDSRLVVHDGSGGRSVLDLKLGVVVDGLDQPAFLSVLLATGDQRGSTGTLKLSGDIVFSDGRHLDADTVRADLRLDLDQLDLSALAGCFESDPAWEGLAGVADGHLGLRKERGQAARFEIDLEPSLLSGTPFLVKMMDAAGAGEGASLGLAPLRFTISGEALHYAEPWAVRIDDWETTFGGEIGLDGSLALEWRLPVTPELARRHPSVAGRIGEILAVPVRGSLTDPRLDWSAAGAGRD